MVLYLCFYPQKLVGYQTQQHSQSNLTSWPHVYRYRDQNKLNCQKMKIQINWNIRTAISHTFPTVNMEENWINICDILAKLIDNNQIMYRFNL